MNYLEKANQVFSKSNVQGVRVCFEQAAWNSVDSNVKTYYHVHVQHDDLPQFNSGMGDSDFDKLIDKLESILLPELEQELKQVDYDNP